MAAESGDFVEQLVACRRREGWGHGEAASDPLEILRTHPLQVDERTFATVLSSRCRAAQQERQMRPVEHGRPAVGGGSMTIAGQQWARARRFRARYAEALAQHPSDIFSFVEIPPDRRKEISRWSSDCQDWAVSCCQNLHHLKDWLKADPEVTVPNATVEQHVADTEVLCIVADICNGTKHAELDRPRTTIQDAGGTGRRMTFTRPSGAPTETTVAQHFVVVDGAKRPLLDLIDAAFAEWQAFFDTHGISRS